MESQVSELSSRTTGTRYLQLDGLRGIAALTVVIHHFRAAFAMKPRWYIAPFSGGHAAVLLFFVLSGFVLSLPFWRNGANGPYGNYLVRRFFRIYVPYLGALILAVIGDYFFYGSRLPLSRWFYETWQTPVTAQLIRTHLLMGGDAQLNTAFWSLRYEVQMSIAFPLLLLGIRLLRPASVLILSFGLYLFAVLAMASKLPDPSLYLETIKYGSLFVVGAVLAQCIPRARDWSSGAGRLGQAALFAIALFLYCGFADYATSKHHFQFPEDLLVSIGACFLVICSLVFAPFRTALHGKIPEYLGRISYSMYLVHATVLFALLNLLYGKFSMPVLAVIYSVATLLVSHIFCILVEEPALRFGKAVARRTQHVTFGTIWRRRQRITAAR